MDSKVRKPRPPAAAGPCAALRDAISDGLDRCRHAFNIATGQRLVRLGQR